ncbi:S8 family serine peptidase, partial [Candidatus Babeliales bacterium]|nr:S8 family serine peptidase [Candidatus Babeliales bacterium]
YCRAKERLGGGENDSLNLKIDRQFLSEFFKKNHGAFVVSLIRQCAPKIEIISIPIFNDQGTTSLEKLLDGLRNALQQNVDILYLGLKVEDNNFLIQKKEILNLLQQFSYVVAPSGNDGLISFTVAFPANSIFFSVGAFEKKNNQYLICDFSQKQIKNGPNFVMPGKNLGCFLWNDQNQKIENYLVSGTSAAAACMVGCLALILYENQQNFTPQQIQYLIQKNSKKLNLCFKNDQSKFGLINTLGCLSCIQQLKVFQKQMSKKKFQKNFKKLVEKVVKMQNEII